MGWDEWAMANRDGKAAALVTEDLDGLGGVRFASPTTSQSSQSLSLQQTPAHCSCCCWLLQHSLPCPALPCLPTIYQTYLPRYPSLLTLQC